MSPDQLQVVQTAKISDTVLAATQSLIQYLEGHTSKVDVINQLESIKTPDVKFVVEALQVLDQTLKDRPLTDLSGVTALMQELVTQAKLIPKTLPEDKEQPFIDYTKQLNGLTEAIKAVENVVKSQPAPVVNVPETNVHVAEPDLKPLQQGFKDVVTAVKKIVIPEYKTDNVAVEKLLKQTNKLLDKILAKPVSSGGGGGSSWPAIGTNNLPQPLHVGTDGGLQTASGLIPFAFDDIQFTNADGNGNYQTGTVRKSGSTVATLTFAYDGSSNLTRVTRS